MSMDSDAYYEKYDHKVRQVVSVLVALSHRHLEKGFPRKMFLPQVLELGAGDGKHLDFVRHKFDRYVTSDLRIDFLNSHIKSIKFFNKGLQHNSTIKTKKINANQLNFPSDSIDRIIAGCLILHLDNPVKALQSWRNTVKHDGYISFYIHCEPGLLLRYSRIITTVLAGKYMKVNHLQHVYSEHKYNYLYIKSIIQNTFDQDEVSFSAFPIPFFSWNFSLWKIVQIKVNKLNS